MQFLLRPFFLIAFIALLIGSLLLGIRIGQKKNNPKSKTGNAMMLSSILIIFSFVAIVVILYLLQYV